MVICVDPVRFLSAFLCCPVAAVHRKVNEILTSSHMYLERTGIWRQKKEVKQT